LLFDTRKYVSIINYTFYLQMRVFYKVFTQRQFALSRLRDFKCRQKWNTECKICSNGINVYAYLLEKIRLLQDLTVEHEQKERVSILNIFSGTFSWYKWIERLRETRDFVFSCEHACHVLWRKFCCLISRHESKNCGPS